MENAPAVIQPISATAECNYGARSLWGPCVTNVIAIMLCGMMHELFKRAPNPVIELWVMYTMVLITAYVVWLWSGWMALRCVKWRLSSIIPLLLFILEANLLSAMLCGEFQFVRTPLEAYLPDRVPGSMDMILWRMALFSACVTNGIVAGITLIKSMKLQSYSARFLAVLSGLIVAWATCPRIAIERVRLDRIVDGAPHFFTESPVPEVAQTKVWFEFKDVPFREAMKQVAKEAGIELLFDPGAFPFESWYTINLRVSDMEATLAMEWIARLGDSEIVWCNGVLVVTNPKRAERMKLKETVVKLPGGRWGIQEVDNFANWLNLSISQDVEGVYTKTVCEAAAEPGCILLRGPDGSVNRLRDYILGEENKYDIEWSSGLERLSDRINVADGGNWATTWTIAEEAAAKYGVWLNTSPSNLPESDVPDVFPPAMNTSIRNALLKLRMCLVEKSKKEWRIAGSSPYVVLYSDDLHQDYIKKRLFSLSRAIDAGLDTEALYAEIVRVLSERHLNPKPDRHRFFLLLNVDGWTYRYIQDSLEHSRKVGRVEFLPRPWFMSYIMDHSEEVE